MLVVVEAFRCAVEEADEPVAYGELDLLYAATVFGSPRDVILDEIGIETFFPANSTPARILGSLAKS